MGDDHLTDPGGVDLRLFRLRGFGGRADGASGPNRWDPIVGAVWRGWLDGS
jgi:hypothetical protein